MAIEPFSSPMMDLPLMGAKKPQPQATEEPMKNEALDQTSSQYRRRGEDYGPPPDPGAFRASGHGINFPTAIFLYLIAQLVGSIWWAATIQAKSSYLEAENAKLWQKIELHDLQLNRQESVIRAQVREFVGDEMDKNRNRD